MLGLIIDVTAAVLGSSVLAWYAWDWRVGVAMFCALLVLYPLPEAKP